MNRLLTIAMVLSAAGCGDPAGSSDTPDKPSCERDEVVAWLEAEHCPDGYVWGVRWEKPGENGTGIVSQYLPRGEEPTEPGWAAVDAQVCFDGGVPSGVHPSHPPALSHWRVENDGARFNYSYYPADEDREYRVSCSFEEDFRALSADIPDGSFERWIWRGDSDKPEYDSFD